MYGFSYRKICRQNELQYDKQIPTFVIPTVNQPCKEIPTFVIPTVNQPWKQIPTFVISTVNQPCINKEMTRL
jgi:hypothetical protein